MAGRIKSMRAQLLQALKDVGAPGTWDHVVHQIGMFSFLGVTKVRSSTCAMASSLCWGLTELCGFHPTVAHRIAVEMLAILPQFGRSSGSLSTESDSTRWMCD